MIKEFSLENFRVFRDKTTFKFKPITILTGPNNSGKSSVNKALMLLKTTFLEKGGKNDDCGLPQELVFDSNEYGLPNIMKVISNNSNKEELVFGFNIRSKMFHCDFNLHFSYAKRSDNPTQESQMLGFTRDSNLESIKKKNRLTSFKISQDKTDLINIVFNKETPAENQLFGIEATYNFTFLYDLFINYIIKESESLLKIRENKENSYYNDYPAKPIHNLIDYFGVGNNAKVNKKFLHNRIIGCDSIVDQILEMQKNGMSKSAIMDQFFSDKMKMDDPLDYKKESIGFTIDALSNLGKNSSSSCKPIDFLNKISEYTYSSILLEMTHDRIGGLTEKINDPKSNWNNEFENIIILSAQTYFLKNEGVNGLRLFLDFVDDMVMNLLEDGRESLSKVNFIPGIKLTNDANFTSDFAKSTLKDVYETIEYYSTFNNFLKRNDISNNFDTKTIKGAISDDPWLKVKFINYWLKKLNIAEEFDVELDEYYHTFKLFLIKGGSKLPINQVGYGVSQLIFQLLSITFPILGDNKNSYILEEPEANLHPKFQSLLADMFNDGVKKLNKSFIIETHSEYLIRKFQFLIAKGECKPEDVIIYYIDDPDPSKREEGAPQVREITIDKHGRMSQDFGKGFFDEADNLAIQLFQLNQQNFN